jgi:hypothetical protein
MPGKTRPEEGALCLTRWKRGSSDVSFSHCWGRLLDVISVITPEQGRENRQISL